MSVYPSKVNLLAVSVLMPFTLLTIGMSIFGIWGNKPRGTFVFF